MHSEGTDLLAHALADLLDDMRRCADLLDDIGDPHGVGDTLAEIAEEIGEEIADDILIADFHAFLDDVSPDDFRIADGA